jgi:hypothetical protein
MSPSEKLLRRKAAEAWRSETMHRQVVQYEYQAVQALAITKVVPPLTSLETINRDRDGDKS